MIENPQTVLSIFLMCCGIWVVAAALFAIVFNRTNDPNAKFKAHKKE